MQGENFDKYTWLVCYCDPYPEINFASIEAFEIEYSTVFQARGQSNSESLDSPGDLDENFLFRSRKGLRGSQGKIIKQLGLLTVVIPSRERVFIEERSGHSTPPATSSSLFSPEISTG